MLPSLCRAGSVLSNGIVEIEERDFYFEISPEDYQDEEANIRNNKKA